MAFRTNLKETMNELVNDLRNKLRHQDSGSPFLSPTGKIKLEMDSSQSSLPNYDEYDGDIARLREMYANAFG